MNIILLIIGFLLAQLIIVMTISLVAWLLNATGFMTWFNNNNKKERTK